MVTLRDYPGVNYADIKRACDTWRPLLCSDDKNPLEIKKLIVDGPATIIFWSDETKTVVKCDKDDVPDYEKGILYAALKKLCNKKEYNDILRTIDEYNDILRAIDALGCKDDASRFLRMLEKESVKNLHQPVKNRSLCVSCKSKECILQTGIVRSHCDFYTAESEE